MFELSQLSLFIGATLALLLVPGPAVLYIVGRSIHQGRLAGLVSVLGIATAGLVHVLAAALGLSALLLTSALAFDLVKYLGALYLLYLGVKTLLAHDTPVADGTQGPVRLRRIYAQGVVVNLLNPKIALFFFAFLPQFVNPVQSNPTWQIVILGAIFVGLALITDSTYALVAGTLAYRLRNNAQFRQGQRWFTGLVYMGLGATTALSGAGHK